MHACIITTCTATCIHNIIYRLYTGTVLYFNDGRTRVTHNNNASFKFQFCVTGDGNEKEQVNNLLQAPQYMFRIYTTSEMFGMINAQQ